MSVASSQSSSQPDAKPVQGWVFYGCPDFWQSQLGATLPSDVDGVVFGPLWTASQIHGELKQHLGQRMVLCRTKTQLGSDPPWGQQGLLALVVVADETALPTPAEWAHALSVCEFRAQQQAEEEKARERATQVENELYTTRQLQQSLLPAIIEDGSGTEADLSFQMSRTHARITEGGGITLQGFYIPCDTLGGDYYDVMTHDDGTVSILVCDVSGHGITAAFITSILKALFYQACRLHQSPDAMLAFMNNQLARILTTGAYVTAVAARLVPEKDAETDSITGWQLEYSIAGHPYPMVSHPSQKRDDDADDGCLRLKNNGLALAWFEGTDYDLVSQPLLPGDKVLLFTDGPTEMVNPEDEIYGEERLQASFVAATEARKTPLLDHLLQDLSDFTCGMPLNDDLSMVLISLDDAE